MDTSPSVPGSPLDRLAGLRFPQSAHEAVEALEGLSRDAAMSLLRTGTGAGADPWVRSTLRRGAGVRCLGMFAVGVLDFFWPVVFFWVEPPDARRRLVSLAMRVSRDPEEQLRAPWLVRSFVRLEPDWALWMGDRSGGASLVCGDDPAFSPRAAAPSTTPTPS